MKINEEVKHPMSMTWMHELSPSESDWRQGGPGRAHKRNIVLRPHPELASDDMARATASSTNLSASSRVKSSLSQRYSLVRTMARNYLINITIQTSPHLTALSLPHLYSESQYAQMNVLPEPSMAHFSRANVPPIGHPYTCPPFCSSNPAMIRAPIR